MKPVKLMIRRKRNVGKRIILLLMISGLGMHFSKINAESTFSYGSDTISTFIDEKVLFLSDELLELTIYFDDFKALRRDVGEDNRYHPAILSVKNEYDEDQYFDLKLKTRGNFRRDRSNCNFPPLRLNFDRDQLDSTVFEGQNKLKLVTPCILNSDEYEQYVILEYLVYKMYNIITDKSLRVRLTKVNFIDKAEKQKSYTIHGFLIEDIDDMAGRNGFREVDLNNIPLGYTDYFYQTLVSVFQYMIGNTDWSVPYAHNIKLIMEKPDLRPIPVPYDFDWCGMVSPRYAIPSHKLNIETVDQRLYRGFTRPIGDFKMVFDFLLSLENEFYKLFDHPLLSEENRERSKRYLEEFFVIIKDDEAIHREFVLASRKINKDTYYGK